MRLLCDVDGVLADFTKYLLNTLDSKLLYEDITEWNFLKHHLSPTEQKLYPYVLRDPSWWENQPLIGGAAYAIDQLRQVGWDIRFVTSPWRGCSDWLKVRTQWCVKHLGAVESDVSLVPRKDFFTCDAYIDDSPEHIEAAHKAGTYGKVFTFDAPYNRQVAGLRGEWATILPTLLQMR